MARSKETKSSSFIVLCLSEHQYGATLDLSLPVSWAIFSVVIGWLISSLIGQEHGFWDWLDMQKALQTSCSLTAYSLKHCVIAWFLSWKPFLLSEFYFIQMNCGISRVIFASDRYKSFSKLHSPHHCQYHWLHKIFGVFAIRITILFKNFYLLEILIWNILTVIKLVFEFVRPPCRRLESQFKAGR